MPGNYSDGFSSCQGDPTEPMGIYTTTLPNGVVSTTTFHQGDPVTPSAHPAAKSSSCTYYPALTNADNNAPAPSPTASLLPSSVSAQLSRGSVSSVSAVSTASAESVSSLASVTSFVASTSRGGASGSGSGAIPSSTSTQSNSAFVTGPMGAHGSGISPALMSAIGGLVAGAWAITLL